MKFRPCFDLDRKRQVQRRPVGLEVGVGPVAVVFGFEDFAEETYFCDRSGRDFMRNGSDINKGLMRRDKIGESERFPWTVGPGNGTGLARASAQGMMHAKADSIAAECRTGFPIEREGKLALRGARDRGMPYKVDIPLLVHGVVGDRKVPFSLVDLQILDSSGDGSPVVIAQRKVNPAEHLAIAKHDSPQVPVRERKLKGAGCEIPHVPMVYRQGSTREKANVSASEFVIGEMWRRSFLQDLALSPAIAASWQNGVPSAYEIEILRMMNVAPVPGAVIGTLRGGKLAWVRPLGVRNVETKEPVTSDTIFQAASLSKQLTAYTAFALRSQGKLDFDKPLVSYVDDLTDPKSRLVTTRHVLSHSSGFPNWRFEKGQALVPEFSPGEKFQYSGEGYFYLQRVLEHVTGMGFGRIIEEFVFRPLEMKSSSMIWTPELDDRFAYPHSRRGELRKNFAKGAKALHEIAAKKGRPILDWQYADYESATRELGDPPLPNWMLPNAAASLVTTAPDYARFVAAATKNAELTKEQIRMRDSLGWGLGWGIERVLGKVYLWQWGDNGGYKNIVVAEPATGDVTFVFTNGDSGARVYDRIVTHATGHDHPALFWI